MTSFLRIPGLLLVAFASVLAACGTDDPIASNNQSNNASCTDECGLGDRTCLDEERLQTCKRGTDGCFRLVTVQCLATELCSDGDCLDQPKNCEDTCTPPTSRCNALGETETCADHNSDGCFEFGGNRACEDGKFCDQADGLCKAPTCENTCTAAATVCQEGLLSTCVADNMGCLTYGPGEECGAAKACEVDQCVASTACEDECVDGSKICGADGGVLTCGNLDGDTCTELSPSVACTGTDVCREGACIPIPTCQDLCLANEKVCVGNDIASCVVQADGCRAFDPPAACPGTDLCVNDGTVQCKAPPMSGAVVINEVFYDALGSDDYRNGAAPTFIELFGPPALDITGYKVELVNGSGGAVYSTATLPAIARLDGNGYAILAIADSDSFLKFAAPGNKFFILTNIANQDGIQNGPDNVKLSDAAGTLVDALGYGSFSGSQFFEGEGPCGVGPCHSAPASGSGRSLGRVNGVDTNDNLADFVSYYPTPGMPNADLIINEIYFDQPGSDTGTETFVEVIAPILGWEDISLDGYVLHAINGLNGTDYINTGLISGIDFTGTMLNEGTDGLVVVCNIDTANAALLQKCTVPFEGTDFQNGPDNFVLEYKTRVIDAIGYGSFSPTQFFVGEGTSKSFSTSSAGKSLGRWPISDASRKNDTNDNSVDFHLNTPSPAQDNPIPN